MASLRRTYRRAKMFCGMNKQQTQLWKNEHRRKGNKAAQHKAEKQGG